MIALSPRRTIVVAIVAVALLAGLVSAAFAGSMRERPGPTETQVKNGTLTSGGGLQNYPEFDDSMLRFGHGILCMPLGQECGPEPVVDPASE